MAEFHGTQDLIGDLSDHHLRYSKSDSVDERKRRTRGDLPIAMQFQFVQDSSITVLEYEMQLVLSLRFEYFDEINEILMLQILPRGNSECLACTTVISHLQHSYFTQSDALDRWIII